MDAQGVDEEELRQHLDEQRAALEQIQQALAAEPSEELEEVRRWSCTNHGKDSKDAPAHEYR